MCFFLGEVMDVRTVRMYCYTIFGSTEVVPPGLELFKQVC